MIDPIELQFQCSSCIVYFKDLPEDVLSGAIYIENEYHKDINRFLKSWGWYLRRWVFDTYEGGYTELTYLPSIPQKKLRELIKYRFPSLPEGALRNISQLKTADLLDYLEDPDDVRFLKSGFMFFKEKTPNGLLAYEFYPMGESPHNFFSYKSLISAILCEHREKADQRRQSEEPHIGQRGALYKSQYRRDEDFADKNFETFDEQTREKLNLFRRQVAELQQSGIPVSLLEHLLHEAGKMRRLVITRKNEIVLPDYNNMTIKMEPLVRAVYFLFLRHPEGIIFKELPDYRGELTEIYQFLRPHGLTERAKKSIEDVTDPLQNAINEKCARIRSAFIDKFDGYLARNYFITGERAEPKKIVLPRELVVWET